MRNDPPAMSGRYNSPDFVGAEDGRSMLNVPQREPEILKATEEINRQSQHILQTLTGLRDALTPVLADDRDASASTAMEGPPGSITPLGRELGNAYATLRDCERVLQDIEDRIEL